MSVETKDDRYLLQALKGDKVQNLKNLFASFQSERHLRMILEYFRANPPSEQVVTQFGYSYAFKEVTSLFIKKMIKKENKEMLTLLFKFGLLRLSAFSECKTISQFRLLIKIVEQKVPQYIAEELFYEHSFDLFDELSRHNLINVKEEKYYSDLVNVLAIKGLNKKIGKLKRDAIQLEKELNKTNINWKKGIEDPAETKYLLKDYILEDNGEVKEWAKNFIINEVTCHYLGPNGRVKEDYIVLKKE